MDRTEMAGHLIRRLHQQSTQVFQARTQAAGFDMTSVQFAALDAIADTPGIDQAGLAATIGFDRATIGGVIERLESKGLVERAVSEMDRRARRLTLTSTGRKMLAASRPVVEALQADILGELSRVERKAFLKLAHKALGLDLRPDSRVAPSTPRSQGLR
ncbi:MAG: winged helix-turn-helix transcriptional regulator [Burkholderiales bacterium]|nr:winged helix-turn-helix transcriptional regulator [Burkholderiales bacterium]